MDVPARPPPVAVTTLISAGRTTATRYAADGTPIDACHDPAVDPARLVVAHGFTGSWRRPAVRRVAAVLRWPPAW